ncbi:MAG: hypothetical protein DLM50_06445 [Candidatus Meridianibacter frigidus]|nr:MAG: hypothetical protein DLM50_06445 [Candidatus Eremiobacteraeota bacterium]
MFRQASKGLSGALLLLLTAACGDKPASIQTGKLTGGTMVVMNSNGNVEAYPPAFGQARDQYTVTETTTQPDVQTRIRWNAKKKVLTVCPERRAAPQTAACPPSADVRADYIVRVPHGVRAIIETSHGTLHVSDIDGSIEAVNQEGDIKIQVPGYAQASTGSGNISATFGDAQWPGTLAFSAVRGNVEVYVPAQARAHVRLHTGRGTIFTDFELRGTSNGNSETIAAPINGGGARSIVVHVLDGDIRLLKLTPQM